MDPFLAIGQIIVSIALVAAILLQARGTGLSGTFGGDSAVYRSRRGVERRLWQFTIILLVPFVLFSLASFVFAPDDDSRPEPVPRTEPVPRLRPLIDPNRRPSRDEPSRPCHRRRPRRRARGHHRRHRCACPGARRGRPGGTVGQPEPSRDRCLSRGVARSADLGQPACRPHTGRPGSRRPRLRALFASGPMARSCRTCSPLSSDASGKTWTFELRADARWHDGEPVTANDVVFTVKTFGIRRTRGPVPDRGTRQPRRPLGTGPFGSTWRPRSAVPPAGDPADRARPPPDSVPIENLGTDPFGGRRSGPLRHHGA